jgi:hypothetical protein
MKMIMLFAAFATAIFGSTVRAESIARQWNDVLLEAIRIDTPRPTVHARNLFHLSSAMYDAWATYDPVAIGYITNEVYTAADIEAAREEAISFAAYRVLNNRFAGSPGAATSLASFNAQMDALGYDRGFTSTTGDSPAAIGNRIAQNMIDYGLADGSNQAGNYADTSGYVPVNPPLVVQSAGITIVDRNRWQPLTIPTAAGGTATPPFLTPHWGEVKSFGAAPDEAHHDPGPPPFLGTPTDAQYKAEFLEVARLESYLTPDDGVTIDISPGVRGNNPLGSNAGSGHAVNPATGLPYASNVVQQGDFGRVLAEFWADGPRSETPPGHWNTIFNAVSDHPALQKRIGGTGPLVNDLEWDLKGYFALNGAVHNAAITAWDIKEAYDQVRPISAIRYMASKGQSSDPGGASYDPDGIPLEPGLVEVITSATTAPGQRHEHLAGNEDKIAIKQWLGHPADPANQHGGVGWQLGEAWVPYQSRTFVTPSFPGYTSGHSTFSRASAEVLTAVTGTSFFPGGLFEFSTSAGNYLSFEDGPSQDVTLTYATYFDASDAAGQSRLWGGIHIEADDFMGRLTGSQIGQEAYSLAGQYYAGTVPEPSSLSLIVIALVGFVLAGVRCHRARRVRMLTEPLRP